MIPFYSECLFAIRSVFVVLLSLLVDLKKHLIFKGFWLMLNERQSRLLRRKTEVNNMNISILVCDDEPSFAERLSALLYKQPLPAGMSINIMKTAQPGTLSDHQLSQFNIMFLDIDMGECSGMDIARRVRKLRLKTILIFVTNYPQFSIEGYEVCAFRYLLKRDLTHKLPIYFRDAFAEIPRDDREIHFSLNGESYHIAYNDILYLESRQRIIYLHTVKSERQGDHFYGTMEKLSEELLSLGFLRVQKSFLVNMAHIQKLNYDKVRLDNGDELPVSQKRYAEIKMQYLEWKSRQWKTS